VQRVIYLLLPNTEIFQQVVVMSEVAHGKWQLNKGLKLFTGFNCLVFDRGDNSLECFKRATDNYKLLGL
jgi:hypothetical protein